MARKVWFITGASKGFGMELAKVALDAGDPVVATARNPKTIDDAFGKHDRLLTLRLDVTSEQQAKEAVDTALKNFGQIDVLVNNAGRGLVGAVEEVTSEEGPGGLRCERRRNVECVTRSSAFNARAQVGPYSQPQCRGRFCFVKPGWGIYCATKFMVEGIGEVFSCRRNLNPSASNTPSLNRDLSVPISSMPRP